MNLQRFTTGTTSIALAVTIMATPALAASAFTDVPSDHWAASSISKMAEKGIVSGIGNNFFAPEATITNAEFVTMIVRQFYNDKASTGGDTWYSPYMTAATNSGCLAGTQIASAPTATINRYDMAQIIYNVMVDKGVVLDSRLTSPPIYLISDWYSIPATYHSAVLICYAMEMLTGIDTAGTFDGEGTMTRAQAATVMQRLIDVVSSAPPISSEIPTGAYILTGDNVTLKGRTMGLESEREYSRYENGKFLLINHLTNSCAAIEFVNDGYSTLTFTVTITADKEQRVSVVDGILWEGRLDIYQSPGTTKKYSVNISGTTDLSLVTGNGNICTGAEVTNIYLTK